MTDRITRLTVVLEKDVREDDIESTRQAILHLRGVIGVSKDVVGDVDYDARRKVAHRIADEIRTIMNHLHSMN